MKTIEGLTGVQLYEATDEAALKASKLFSREGRGRLVVDRRYQLIGFCHVEASKDSKGRDINAWDGVLLKNIETGKMFPVSPNTLMGLTFTQNSDGTWTAHQVAKPKFIDIDEVKKSFNTTVKCVNTDDQPSFDFATQANGTKKVYLFE